MTHRVIHMKHFGAQLGVRNDMFSIYLPDLTGKNEHRTENIAASHVQTILMHPQTSLTTNAMLLATRQGTTCIIINEKGEPEIFLAGITSPGALAVWKRQLELHGTPKGLAYSRDWLLTKIDRKLEFLPKLSAYRRQYPEALTAIRVCEAILVNSRKAIKEQLLQNVSEASKAIMGHEGFGQKAWLNMMNDLLPNQYKFEGRSRGPSKDLFNAMLNYAYGILYNWVESALWKANVNPYFGFLHRSDRDNKAMLYDFIEPYRPWMDRVVFKLCAAKTIQHYHAEPLNEGGVWLTKDGRKLVAAEVYKSFQETRVTIKDKNWNLLGSIDFYARHLSADLKGREAA
jgi:CRISP-associated protein Cas1